MQEIQIIKFTSVVIKQSVGFLSKSGKVITTHIKSILKNNYSIKFIFNLGLIVKH